MASTERATSGLPTRTFWRGTLIGTLGSPARPGVGTAGTLRLEGGWDLGWWIGAEDRWHLPEVEAAVRQRLVDEAPVVETAMRVPGGDVVQRVFAAAGSERYGPLAVTEIENASAVPVAAAVVVRGLPDRLEVIPDGEGATVRFTHAEPGRCEPRLVEHRLLFERAPSQVAQMPGLAVFIFTLAHTATLRVAVPMEQASGDRFPAGLPPATAVAKGWEAQGGRGVRIDVPEPAVAGAVDAARRALLLAELGNGALVGDQPGRRDWVRAHAVLTAFDRLGFGPEAQRMVACLETELGLAGAVDGDGRVDAAGAALGALAHHVGHMGDRDLADASVELVAALATGLHRRAVPARRLGRPNRLPQPHGVAPGSVDEPSWWTWWWAVTGLTDAAVLFDLAGQADAAREARADLDRLQQTLRPLLDADRAAWAGALPVRPGGPMDALAASVLWPAGVLVESSASTRRAQPPAGVADWLALTHVLVGATTRWLGDHATDDRGRILIDPDRPALTRPLLTALLVRAQIAHGEVGAVARLNTLVADGGGLRSWPEVHDPSRPTVAERGACPDLAAAAMVVHAGLDLVVGERADGLVLVPVLPPSWYGQGIEVHDAPTRFGALSYAVRWHGERPALLWQLDLHEGLDPDAVRLTAPGLDRSWSSTQARGETLLEPPSPDVRSTSRPASGSREATASGSPSTPGSSTAPSVSDDAGSAGSRAPDGSEPPPEGGSFS